MITYKCIKCNEVLQSPESMGWDGDNETCPKCNHIQKVPKPKTVKCNRCQAEWLQYNTCVDVSECRNCGSEIRNGRAVMSTSGVVQSQAEEPRYTSQPLTNTCTACGYQTDIDNMKCPKCGSTYFVKAEKKEKVEQEPTPAHQNEREYIGSGGTNLKNGHFIPTHREYHCYECMARIHKGAPAYRVESKVYCNKCSIKLTGRAAPISASWRSGPPPRLQTRRSGSEWTGCFIWVVILLLIGGCMYLIGLHRQWP